MANIAFPARVVFIDTGERRWPRSGEYFVSIDDKGEFATPRFQDESPEELPMSEQRQYWAYPPRRYAIYTMRKEE